MSAKLTLAICAALLAVVTWAAPVRAEEAPASGPIAPKTQVAVDEVADEEPEADTGNGNIRYAPKLSFRFSYGAYLNEGRARGGAPVKWGPSISYMNFVTPDVAIGGTYNAVFNFGSSQLSINGLSLFTRIYFFGNGTRVSRRGERIASDVLDSFGLYVGPQLGYTGYYFGINPYDVNQTDVLTGSFYSVDGIAGIDYRISRKVELNVEGAMGLRSFSYSDSRYRMKAFLVTTGISFLF